MRMPFKMIFTTKPEIGAVPRYEFPTERPKPMTDKISSLKRVRLRASATNPRKRFDQEKLEDLAASMRKVGVLEPLLVRTLGPQRNGSTEYEIIAGERRWRAAELAGLEELPCIVKDGLNESEVLEVQYIENLQRDDLSPIEEADGFAKLIESWGCGTEEGVKRLEEKLGKKRTYFYDRLKLCKLAGPVREALEQGTIPPTVGTLLARVSPTHQGEALKDITARGDVMSFRQAQNYLKSNYSPNLATAKWDLEDSALLPDAGPCTTCPKRAGNCLEEYPEFKRSPNVCTDLGCFNQKKLAHRAQVLERAGRERGRKILTLAQCDDLFEYGSWFRDDSEWTQLDRFWISTGNQRVCAEEVLKKVKSPCSLAVDGFARVYELYRKEDLLKELAAAGYKPQSAEEGKVQVQESPEDRAKRELRAKLALEIRLETNTRLGKAVIDRAAKVPMVKGERALWLIMLWTIADNLHDDVCDEYGFPRNAYGTEALTKAAAKLKDAELRKFVIEQALAADGFNQQERYFGDFIESACALLKVDGKKIAQEVKKELTAKAKETLVWKQAHGKLAA